MTAKGTTPPGATSEEQAANWVRGMFADVAPKYDLLNHLLSFNIDRGWRTALVEALRAVLDNPDARVLDLCCGTGDVTLELAREARASVFGADFCHPMLVAAQRKVGSPLLEADALRLPLADSSVDGIAIAFGFRNLANYEAGLRELHRVLRPGGLLAILEFSHPRNLFVRAGYSFYSRLILPAAGALISGSARAYTYLPESIRKFPPANFLQQMFTDAGFTNAGYRLLTGGIAALHVGAKAPRYS